VIRFYAGCMKTKFILLCAIGLLNAAAVRACGISPQLYAKWVLSTNDALASNAVVTLRAAGRDGLNALLETHQQLLASHHNDDPQWIRLRAALDAVGGQRDCHASRLFWHTNFDDAKVEAQRTGKPILSLRLLGNLNEELSCANSRFFRTTLYANSAVSDYLRDHFVLHWKSVRPVPRISIDMGDGRKIERTITGNSIHYVLAANGEVVDALPGLYGPRAFLAGLKSAEEVATRTTKLDSASRGKWLENFHTAALSDINERWAADLRLAKTGSVSSKSIALANAGTVPPRNPPAAQAMPRAVAKAAAEFPLLRSLTPRRAELERSTDDALWAKIAALHNEDAVLDAPSLALIRAKTIPAAQAMRLALSKRIVEDPMLKTIQNLQRSIAEDTVRNEYTFHARIHEWLATANAPREVDLLNQRVYAELFLTPDSDPWLGLAPQETFSALENGGLVQNATLPTPAAK
jgi:hypothetical protein